MLCVGLSSEVEAAATMQSASWHSEDVLPGVATMCFQAWQQCRKNLWEDEGVALHAEGKMTVALSRERLREGNTSRWLQPGAVAA